MKKKTTVTFIAGMSLILSGCVSVKTQHKVEPIHITMDINVKVQKELEDFFGDIYGEPTEATETE